MKLLRGVLLLTIALAIPSLAWAGKIQVDGMKKGSQAVIKTYDANNKVLATITVNDTNGDGKAAVEINNQDNVKRITIYKLDPEGKRQIENGKFTALSLLGNEPFALPQFFALGSSLGVLASFDVEAFLGQPNPFTLGQVLTVTNGVIAQTSAITFKDPMSLAFPPDEPFDVALLDSLPNFSGELKVGPDTLYVVPEPATLALSGLGLALLWLGRRSHARNTSG